MKRNLLAAAAASLALGSAQAQMQMPPVTGLYGELGYSWLKIDAAGGRPNPQAVRGVLGYDFHPMFAAEGFIAGGVHDDATSGVVNGVPVDANVKLKALYGLLIKPKYRYQQGEVFARLGWAHSDVDVDSRTAGFASTSHSHDDFAWGLGANGYFTPNFYGGIDWMRYSNQSGHRIDGITLAVGFHW